MELCKIVEGCANIFYGFLPYEMMKNTSLINDISGGNKVFIKLPNDSTVQFRFFNQQVTGQNCTFSPWSNLMEKRINLLFLWVRIISNA